MAASRQATSRSRSGRPKRCAYSRSVAAQTSGPQGMTRSANWKYRRRGPPRGAPLPLPAPSSLPAPFPLPLPLPAPFSAGSSRSPGTRRCARRPVPSSFGEDAASPAPSASALRRRSCGEMRCIHSARARPLCAGEPRRSRGSLGDFFLRRPSSAPADRLWSQRGRWRQCSKTKTPQPRFRYLPKRTALRPLLRPLPSRTCLGMKL
mmetsp:Transcript_58192/g.180797  ORF Transcript_58192/g.180797 Transcript_58192/m.180797 type:complete len:206 (-) Transcript_58192:455-1072(-)